MICSTTSNYFEHSPYVGTPIKGHPQLRRLLHSPLYVYYRLDENRGAIEILHFWHSSRAPILRVNVTRRGRAPADGD